MSAAGENYRAFRERGGFAPLDRALLRISGEDRERYLNGQISNAIGKLRDKEALPACVTNAKGQLDALVWLHGSAESLLLDAPLPLREPIAARLERYIVADDVAMEDCTGALQLAHVIAEAPPALAGAEIFRCARFREPGWDVLGKNNELDSELVKMNSETIESLRVENLVPAWDHELSPGMIPLEAGVGEWAVDFEKGCYIGQEVISRIKSIGKIRRILCQLEAEEKIPAGAQLKDREGADAGAVTTGAFSFGLNKPLALGYVRTAFAAEGGFLLAHSGGSAEPLPVQIRQVASRERYVR